MNSDRARPLGRVLAVIAGIVWFFSVNGLAPAQEGVGPVEVIRATGQVEILRKQTRPQVAAATPEAAPGGREGTPWVAGAVGAKLGEGDNIRALSRGLAELRLPDGTRIILAENTRIVITKLEFDSQNRPRNVIFHLAVGKVRVELAPEAIPRVRAGQTTVAISTAQGVASAAGTTVVFYDAARKNTVVSVLGQGSAQYTALDTKISRTITGGNFSAQEGGRPPSEPTSTKTLPAAGQALLAPVETPGVAAAAVAAAAVAFNPVTAGQTPLYEVGTTNQPLLRDVVEAAAGPPPATATPVLSAPPPTPSRPNEVTEEKKQTCASPPC